MEKVAIRKGHMTNSQLALLTALDQYHCQTIQALAEQLGDDGILRMIYQDEQDCNQLKENYACFLQGGKSQHFEWGYMLSPKHVLCIGNHISFCCLDTSHQFFPWRYTSRGIYLADTWWFQDDEIIKDATSMTVVEFLQKYS